MQHSKCCWSSIVLLSKGYGWSLKFIGFCLQDGEMKGKTCPIKRAIKLFGKNSSLQNKLQSWDKYKKKKKDFIIKSLRVKFNYSCDSSSKFCRDLRAGSMCFLNEGWCELPRDVYDLQESQAALWYSGLILRKSSVDLLWTSEWPLLQLWITQRERYVIPYL